MMGLDTGIFYMLILFYCNNLFVGIFLQLLMFTLLCDDFYLLGLSFIKGDLFGMLGMDYISFFMILLLLWVISLVLILFEGFILNILGLILVMSMFIMFISMDMFYLYINFEFSMLPMFLIILFFGMFKERFLAGLYMFIYTMVSSLPMLVIMMFILKWACGLNISYMMFNLFDSGSFIKIIFIIMFLVKVPMFIVHIWLPKAHVEAPVYGSMILASIMLKMGGYGIIRCFDIMEFNVIINDFFFCLCMAGSVFISYMCLYQVDLKVLVAYSSIIHMGIMLMGIFSGSELGYVGALIVMLCHGICSSGMFYLVDCIYFITGSRLLLLNKGLMSVAPGVVWMWLGMLINNMDSPPCFGVLGELLLMSGSLMYSFMIYYFFIIIIFFVSCFVINMCTFLLGGSYMGDQNVGLSVKRMYGVIMHYLPLDFFIFFILVCF